MVETTRERKRKSRFSDAPSENEPPAKAAKGTHGSGGNVGASGRVVDPAALAKLAAAKIAQALPNGLAKAPAPAPTTTATPHADATEQQRIAEEQRKRADLIMKSVQQQMSHIQTLLKKPTNAPVPTPAATSTFMPAPLLLDEQGRQIDENGNVVAARVPAPVATLRANKSGASAAKSNQNPYLSHRTVDKEDRVDAVDPRLKAKRREARAAKSFSFVQQGTYVKQAENLRAREAKKMLAGFTSGRNPRGYQKEAIVPIDEDTANGLDGAKTETPESMEVFDVDVPIRPEPNTPDVEWWDIEYLPKDKKAAVDKFGFIKVQARKDNPEITIEYAEMKAKFCGTLHVIEHPARLNPAFKQDTEPVAIPLMLTAAERKKIRRQNRAEREKEKQDKIAIGLMPPPEPKVKLSNMMKVLGEQAVADPSAIERKVRQQMAQREKNHEMRNLARKLTPEERREKKLRKIKEDAAGDIHVAVFRVPDLANPQHRFKVDVNAQQYHLTGGVLICKEDNINVIIVEGGRKAIKHYTRLLTKRIRWNDNGTGDDASDDEASDDENAENTSGCVLVWQGIVARRAFNNFRFQECRTATTARKVMETKNVVHYWDLVEKSMQ
ncbi:hypothetical protein Poli38472_000496 [Pythium oligandrum]|uniref:Uncharacterized protein n=1 Tax=Pythium oligandrum TaxID=41045 RepID=A0A8K1CCE6_PYTOL|nr:hypothetical protein Poli38472_000496 [Pythium oligandrum]|eukprot:TMW60454.1 hypothetical protein Poli38472_000496 [Pythium oligandrum]